MGIIIQDKEMLSSELKSDKHIRLHSEQLVIEAIDIMLKQERYTMPVFCYKKYIGIISFKDLISFVTHKEMGENLIYHKLNFSIESVMIISKQILL